MNFLVIIVVMFVVMYFLAIRPQQKKQRAAQEMLSKVGPGDEVVTIGGIYADVVEVHDDRVVLEIAEDVHIEVARRAIAQIVPPESETAIEPPSGGEYDEPDARSAPAPARTDRRFGGVFGKRSG